MLLHRQAEGVMSQKLEASSWPTLTPQAEWRSGNGDLRPVSHLHLSLERLDGTEGGVPSLGGAKSPPFLAH